MQLAIIVYLALAASVHAHLAAFTKGMYCLNGSTGNNLNSDDPNLPLYDLEFDQWWMHAFNGCDKRPPNPGDNLTLPAGGSVTLQLGSNQAFTDMSYGGKFMTAWPNGQSYPDNYNDASCITAPNLHTQNESMAAGTALAISYQSDITKVTPENLVVMSVAYNTPFKLLATYHIPAGLPACPKEGCICAWSWIPNGCGQSNMYLEAIRCTVTGETGSKPLGTPKPPVWCQNNSSACVKGPKQMLYWHQASGNNIVVDGYDLAGEPKSPGYNAKCGFANGAQNDIFESTTSVSKRSTDIATAESSSQKNVTTSKSAHRRRRRNFGADTF
ncbi:hypothetical protein BT96DRAFT_305390 [Gymnopus androsaceus JB14]|uniref:Lytic polysaccharide monooxygenase n=1 Tax=Gymnopus androsaceus JB14 TaxID=1447944 RepID=A0A6A4I7G7_9AGAR|nr:hypothetical protein BT96DRAFT_305390 [Gymnopus androsaceus JB14]